MFLKYITAAASPVFSRLRCWRDWVVSTITPRNGAARQGEKLLNVGGKIGGKGESNLFLCFGGRLDVGDENAKKRQQWRITRGLAGIYPTRSVPARPLVLVYQ